MDRRGQDHRADSRHQREEEERYGGGDHTDTWRRQGAGNTYADQRQSFAGKLTGAGSMNGCSLLAEEWNCRPAVDEVGFPVFGCSASSKITLRAALRDARE